ncbi:MAG: flagellar biosynthesis protein FlhB [Pseudobdellovibrionaceae bacterium]
MAEGDTEDDSSKTEDPSAKKLEEARKRGQVAQSRDLTTWIMFLAATILVGTAAPTMFESLSDYLKGFLENADSFPTGTGGLIALFQDSLFHTGGATLIFFLVLIVAAIFGPTMQIGLLYAPEVLKPDLSKISPQKGLKRLFSLKSVVEFIKGLLKLIAIGVVGYVMTEPYFDGMSLTIDQDPKDMLEEMKFLTIRMMSGILVALLAIALADFLYQRWEYMKQMRMTKQEVKEEYKQTEGDPYIKAKLKQMRMQRARQRMMQNVPKADVVITNPTHFSVALRYNPDEAEAPIVIAKGVDNVAFRIREIAKEHDIIIYENPPLARTLYDTVEIDQMIPETLYKAVAEIITFVYKKKGKLKK